MLPFSVMVDHSRLREASRGQHADEVEQLRQMVASSHARFIASILQLYEISQYPDHVANQAEADLIDSLSPRWLRLGRELIDEELRNELHRRRGEDDKARVVNPFYVSPSQHATKPGLLIPGQDSARGWIDQLNKHPEYLGPAREAIRDAQYLATLRDLMEMWKQGKRDFRRERDAAARRMLARVSPQRDHDGRLTSQAERDSLAAEVDFAQVPTFATEIALMDARVRRNFDPSESEIIDLQWAEPGLPYVDAIVMDRQFSDVARQASMGCPAIRANRFTSLAGAVEYLANQQSRLSCPKSE